MSLIKNEQIKLTQRVKNVDTLKEMAVFLVGVILGKGVFYG